jgi:hypothetical protein
MDYIYSGVLPSDDRLTGGMSQEEIECSEWTGRQALIRCYKIQNFEEVIPLLRPFYEGTLATAIARKLAGDYLAELSESLRKDPFYPSSPDVREALPVGFLLSAKTTAAVFGMNLQSLMNRVQRKRIDPKFYESRGQRLFFAFGWVLSERDRLREESKKAEQASEKKLKKVDNKQAA